MSPSPTGVGSYLVGKLSAELIEFYEDMVVDDLDVFFDRINSLIIKLLHVLSHCINHVRADDWIMSVRIQFYSKDHFDERIPKSYTHGIDKDVAWLQVDGVATAIDEG